MQTNFAAEKQRVDSNKNKKRRQTREKHLMILSKYGENYCKNRIFHHAGKVKLGIKKTRAELLWLNGKMEKAPAFLTF